MAPHRCDASGFLGACANNFEPVWCTGLTATAAAGLKVCAFRALQAFETRLTRLLDALQTSQPWSFKCASARALQTATVLVETLAAHVVCLSHAVFQTRPLSRELYKIGAHNA